MIKREARILALYCSLDCACAIVYRAFKQIDWVCVGDVSEIIKLFNKSSVRHEVKLCIEIGCEKLCDNLGLQTIKLDEEVVQAVHDFAKSLCSGFTRLKRGLARGVA